MSSQYIGFGIQKVIKCKSEGQIRSLLKYNYSNRRSSDVLRGIAEISRSRTDCDRGRGHSGSCLGRSGHLNSHFIHNRYTNHVDTNFASSTDRKSHEQLYYNSASDHFCDRLHNRHIDSFELLRYDSSYQLDRCHHGHSLQHNQHHELCHFHADFTRFRDLRNCRDAQRRNSDFDGHNNERHNLDDLHSCYHNPHGYGNSNFSDCFSHDHNADSWASYHNSN